MSGRNKQPIDLLVAKGRSHKTKAEIAERSAAELKPLTDGIEAPPYLLKAQKEKFYVIAGQLQEWGIMSATDCNALARYVVAVDNYWYCVKKLRTKEAKALFDIYDEWSDKLDKWDKQCCRLESKLGLTPVDRAKLIAPKTEEEPKVNRFAKFAVTGKASGDNS